MATKEKEIRMDEYTLGAFKDQLLFLEPQLLEEEMEDLYFADGTLIPMENLEIPWAQDTAYRQTTGLGSWEIARDYITHIPMVETLSQEFRQKVFKFIAGYRYTDDEMMQAVHLNEPIEESKMKTVITAGNQKLDDLIFKGGDGLQGFLNHPDTLKMYAAYPISAASTANQILATLINGENAMVNLTRNIEKPDTMLIAKVAYDYANYAQLNTINDTSILEYYLKKSPYIKNVQPLLPLNGVGENGSNVACLYKRDKSKLKARTTESIGFRKFIPTAWGIERTATMRYGGLILYRPYSILWMHYI
ncbi:major capsid family protein [Pseudanabaena sp. 'Roaring Creek']|uniref:major capsid family protein n=1 Tax=Pseudanabaena sp. 'Roaring Creek' TaxID=1681830 RepID=UPI0006D7F5C3|nr:major capsid family protein [Pseudanabaena sp. 'Roaring Creek']